MGVISYFAWYEFYPKRSVTISILTIGAGDEISANVTYSTAANKFTIKIEDVTTGKSFTHSAAVSGAVRSSAEWIAEAPTYLGSITALPNFGTVSFGKDKTSVTGTDSATISGATKVISKFGSMTKEIVMTNTTNVKAQPSALSVDGSSFSVTWVSAGP